MRCRRVDNSYRAMVCLPESNKEFSLCYVTLVVPPLVTLFATLRRLLCLPLPLALSLLLRELPLLCMPLPLLLPVPINVSLTLAKNVTPIRKGGNVKPQLQPSATATAA